MGSENKTESNVVSVCDWLQDARIFNNKLEKINNDWLIDQVEVIVLYFSMKDVDRSNIMQKFCEIYKKARQLKIQLPFEVINVPMDDIKEDMFKSYNNQAEWATLRHGDPLILTLQYRYSITCVPHLLVMKTDGSMVSSHGILDIDAYGINALLTWMSTAANKYKSNRDYTVHNIRGDVLETPKPIYNRKFSVLSQPTDTQTELRTTAWNCS